MTNFLHFNKYRVSLYGFALSVYAYIHEHYRIVDVDSDSLAGWIFAFFWIDFIYYWLHRARHEVNILWADHQVHHSGEDYNLNISFRISPLEYAVLFMYLTVLCAPLLPAGIALVHMQVMYLYQYTLHTELIPNLGWPLECILNTPSAHRVHHGRQRACIDKNYGATLIIWDRIFGTYESESNVLRNCNQIRYGLVHPVATFNPIKLLFFYYGHIYNALANAKDVRSKLKTLFYGPGWVRICWLTSLILCLMPVI